MNNQAHTSSALTALTYLGTYQYFKPRLLLITRT